MEDQLPDFKDLELLVAEIQRQLAPKAEVLHDQRVIGKYSKRSRQIDVLVRDKVGQYEIQIVIDCKDTRRPADVKAVEQFVGLVADVGAQKGVLVCPAGFTKSAKLRAEADGIELYSPIDTNLHKWTVNPSVPALCDFRQAAFQFVISMTGGPPDFLIPWEFWKESPLSDAEGRPLGTLLGRTMELWNGGQLPLETGLFEEVRVFEDPIYLADINGLTAPVDLALNMKVEKALFWGSIPITKISGFKDERRGQLITNAFTCEILDAETVVNEWMQVDGLSDCPKSPAIVLQGLVGYDVENPTVTSLDY